MEQLALPLTIPFELRDYHAYEPWSYKGEMDMPLGCKVCNQMLVHPIHGLSPAELARLEARRKGS